MMVLELNLRISKTLLEKTECIFGYPFRKVILKID